MQRFIAIIGSRKFLTPQVMRNKVFDYVKLLATEKVRGANITIISGGAPGADSFAEEAAKYYKIPFILYKAEWDLYPRAAGYIRNTEMANKCTECVAFHNGVESKGTNHMIKEVEKLKKPVVVFYEE